MLGRVFCFTVEAKFFMKIKKIFVFFVLLAFFATANLAVARIWGNYPGFIFMLFNLPIFYVIKKYAVERKVNV